jgi:hypothetical protein
MKKRYSFALALGVLLVIVVAAELVSRQVVAARRPTRALTSTASRIPTATWLFANFPTHRPVSMSPTSLPLRATYTLIPGETPELVATPTLLPIATATLLPTDSPPSAVPTLTLISFPSGTVTPSRGTATPQVPVAFIPDGKPKACYKGPSPAYIQLDTFNQPVRVAGKDVTGQWWYILIYKGQGNYVSCWVAADLVTVGGDLSSLSVTEPETPQITHVTVDVPGGALKNGGYVATIACDDGVSTTTLHFSGQIFTDGPIKDIGYAWNIDAPVKFKPEHTSVKSWDAPATIPLDLPLASTAGVYTLTLRTTFPVEAVGTLQVVVQCK